ncbi:hypothetical protein [Thalassotalea maritima]|uniref:hypothetical protein n=1 Tax=Thalassotalea maritima TaxID=3242416 RepID=UPI003527EFD4
MTNHLKPAPKWFVPVAAIALVWNLIGVMAFFTGPANNQAALAELPAVQQVFFASMPTWVLIAFAIAVFAGSAGCLFLALKKRFSVILFALSLLGIIGQQIHAFVLNDGLDIFGQNALIMPILVLIVAIALLQLSQYASKHHWLD